MPAFSYSDSLSAVCQKLELRQRRSATASADIRLVRSGRSFVPVSQKAKDAVSSNLPALARAGWRISLWADGRPWMVERGYGRGYAFLLNQEADGSSFGVSADAETLEALEALGAFLRPRCSACGSADIATFGATGQISECLSCGAVSDYQPESLARADALLEAERRADEIGAPVATDDSELGTALSPAQRLSAALLLQSFEETTREPWTLRTALYGTGAVVAVLSADNNPAPNPVQLLFEDGLAHVVESQSDFERWTAMLSHPVVLREGDSAFVIRTAGTYYPLTDR